MMHSKYKNFCVGVEPAKNLKKDYNKKIIINFGNNKKPLFLKEAFYCYIFFNIDIFAN